jgi:FkbM family methyltransferase
MSVFVNNNSSLSRNNSQPAIGKLSVIKNTIAVTVGLFLMIILPAQATAATMSFLKKSWRRKIAKCTDPDYLYRRTRLKVKHRLDIVRIGDCSLIVDSGDHIGNHIWITGELFEKNLLRVGEMINISKDDIVVDIGANIGSASIPLAVATDCELIAVEASKQTASLLCRNASINNVRCRIAVKAVSDSREHQFISLYKKEANQGSSSLSKEWNTSECTNEEIVEVDTIDDIINSYEIREEDIKLIKMDIEGHEYYALKGGIKTINKSRAVLILEYKSKPSASGEANCAQALDNEIKRLGYEIYSIDDGALGPFDPTQTYENIICIPKERCDIEGLLKG